MTIYSMTPEERRARAQAIIQQRDYVAQVKRNNKLYNAYRDQELSKIAVETAERREKEDQNWFIRGLSTIGDVVANVLEGAVKGLEGIYDLGAGIVGAVGGIFSDDFQDSVKEHIAYDFAGEVIGDPLQEALRYSYLKEDGIIEGVSHGIGQLLPAVIATIATYGAYAGAGAATTAASAAGTAASAASTAASAAQAAQIASLVTMGVSAAGTGTEQAFQEGANYYAGLGYGVASGLVEVGTEKLFGGATKALTGAGIFDGVVESTAKTGFRRIAQNAVEEGVEEVVAELANPALKTIYKGADAFSEYGEADYWKGVGKSAIVGSLTALGYSGTIGYGMSKIKTKDGRRLNYVGKEADIQEVLGSLENLKAREKNLQESGTGLTEKKAKIAETTRRGYQQIETILKGATESRRASLVKEFSLGKAFNPDGSLSTEMATRLGIGQPTTDTENGDSTTLASDVNDYNYSTSLWGREAEIETDFSAAIEDLAKTYMEEAQERGETVSLDEARAKVGRITIKRDGLEGVAMERRNKFNKALNVLNRLGHTDTSFVIVDSSELMSGEEGFSFEGFKRGDKIYIDATAFENDTWAETLVHEETHLEEGSQEYEEMVAFLQSDDLTIDDGNGGRVKLWEKAQSEVFAKKYGLSAPQIETISEKIKAGEPLTEQETKMYAKFRNELVAHETGILLGNGRFIDRIISKDSSIAKRIIDKIINLKKMFQKVDMSKAEYKQLLQAERLYFRAAQRIGDIKLAKYILSRDRDFEEEVDTEGEISYNKRKGIYIDDKQEYAILAQELARKNGDKPRRIEYAYTDKNFYIVADNKLGNFTPILQLDIESNHELIETIRSEIDNGTYKQAKTFAEWVRLVQSGEGGYGSHLDGSPRGRANGRVDEVYDAESEGDGRRVARKDGGNQEQVDGTHIVSDDGSTVQFNLTTYREGGREVLEKNLLAKGFSTSDVDSALSTMDELASFMEGLGTTYKDLADWNNARVYYDENGHAIYSAMVTNGDYPLNIDLSTICRKRKALTRVLNELVKRNLIGDVSLSQENIVKINEVLKKNGFEVACPACFVETKRYRIESWAADFVSVWNKVVRSLNIATPESLDFTSGKTTVTNGESVDVAELARRIEAKEFGGRENQLIAKTILEHPELRGYLKKSDLIGTVGLDSIKKNAPELYQRVLNKKGSATPKPMQEFTPYSHELADITDLASRAKDVGGVRMFSFSDFTIDQVFDYMQVIADLHSKKATMHTYTKVISFARIFGKTGIKINMSMIPNIDKSVSRENAGLDSEGNLLWSEFGVDYDEAVALMSQEGYSQNVGTTTIGVSDNHIRKLLANPHTNYIIPYHRSGINKLVAKMSDIDFYKDYTLQQRTRYRKNGVGAEIKYADGRDTIHPKDGRGKAVSKTEEFDFFESLQRLGDAKAMAHEYLEWCDEKGFIPKFEQFTADENYYKLLVDFRVYDAITGEAVPQVPATLTFPDNVTEIIEAELATQEIAKGKEAEVFEDTLSEIYDVIRKDSKRTEGRVFESGDESVQWSLRTKEPPKKTIKAYKVFFAKNGGLYPPMVANPNGEPTPIGVWLDADIGASAGVSKTGRPQVKAGGKGTQGGSGALAFRPGWHLGEYPKATQFNRLNPETGKKELFPKDFVWAECEIAADIDYQEEAMSYGYTENGKFRHSYAGLPKLPTDGYYQYRTNPDPSTVPWYITGAMKVTRILDDNDVREILKKFGVEPIEREGGDINLSKYGLTHGVVDEDVEFSLTLPEDPTAKPYFYELTDGQVKKLLADYTRRKVYNKVEAEEIISTIVGSYLSFGDAYGTISGKPKAEVIDMLWRGLNTAVPGKKAKVALDVAEYIIQHSIVESIYDDPAYEIYTDTIALLKPYLHKMNLDGIKGEIRHRYDKDNSPYLLWGKRKGESGLGADVIAMELESLGFHIDAINEADIFFQIDEAYRTAVAGLKKDAKSILSDSLTTEERKQLKQDLAREILVAFDTHGHPSKLSAIIDEYAKKAQFWREKFYEERNKNKVLNRVLDKIQRIKDIKLGTFINASVYKTDIFKGSIEQLSRIKYRGNLNESGTREIIKGLLEWYNEENPMLEGQFDEDIANALRTFANGEGQITTEDLKALENIVDYFKHFIETYNKVYRNGQYVEAEPIAKKYVEIIRTNEKAKVGWLRKFFEKYITTFSDPMTVMRYMDRYSDGFFTEMLGTLRQGTIGAGVMEMEMREPLEAFYKKHKKFLKSLQDKTVTYQGSEIPLSQAMLLYMSLNRDQAILGLAKSGFAYTDKDGKIVRINGFATQEGLEIEEIRIRAKEVQKELASQFSEVEKEYIAIAEKLFNEDCKEAKKKTDMQLRGYTNALEDYYVPIRRYVVGQSVDTESYLDEMARVSNASFNKDTVKGAKNELYIGTLESVLDRHIRAVALYANLAMPLREYDVLYNLDISGNRNKPTSVKTEGVNAWAEGQEYFQKLVKDIQGIPASTSVLNKWLSKLRGGYAKYQLGANPKVWVTQLSSFAAAGNILDIDCIIRGIGIKASDVDEYCSLAKLRNNDNSAALAQGVMDKTGKIGDVLMKPIGMVDRLVVAKLFGACQVQVEKNGGAKVGTKENKIEAGKLLEKVILETQQNPLATERSAAMRDGSEIMKTLTMFSADSMKVFGRVIDSIGEVAVLKTKRKNATDPKEQAELDKKIKSANKKAGRAVASLVSQAVFMALIAQAFRTLYNKDDEDENIAQNMAVDAVGNLFGGLPLIRDIYSFYAEGYDLDNYAYSTVNDLLQSGKDVFDLIGSVVDGSTDSRDIALSIKKAAYAGGQLFGIPTRNVYNFVYGITKRISPSTAYKVDDKFYKQSYRADLAKAIERGDEAMIATIAELMLDENLGGLKDSEARSEMSGLIEKGFDVIPRSVQDTITYDGEEYTLTASQRKAFEKVYAVGNEAVASLVKLPQYAEATDEVKAKAINFIYSVYYNLALQDFLGVDLENKNILFAEAIDIEKLALIVATARTIVGDTDKKGKVVSGSRKKKVQAYINSLNLKAVQKYMVMGYLGYSNQYGEVQVKAYINRLSLTKSEKEKLLAYSGYSS